MDLIITPDGTIRCIYDELIDVTELGVPQITRASHVEPTDDGRWTADLAPVAGPVLGPFARRSDALDAEQRWLADYWLVRAR
jgi:hypothetical protein